MQRIPDPTLTLPLITAENNNWRPNLELKPEKWLEPVHGDALLSHWCSSCKLLHDSSCNLHKRMALWCRAAGDAGWYHQQPTDVTYGDRLRGHSRRSIDRLLKIHTALHWNWVQTVLARVEVKLQANEYQHRLWPSKKYLTVKAQIFITSILTISSQ